MFDYSNYSGKSQCYDDSNTLVVSKMKDEKLVLLLKNLLD